ncbi:MAG: isocitrate/isopropylmalate dehydrogenase family protein [Anaerolineae bacterium]|nr:isocitrate/isopropylmalate dehydrogenase family protein [Anaerolineae bacterium]MDW8070086.1 isocitrate/isopropylmalate dehydrogenase family protein [Anaerolineae bacterium]
MTIQETQLCVIPGDGVGQEVIPAAVAVLRAVMPQVQLRYAEAGWETFQRTGNALPEETLAAARQTGVVLFGAVASPAHPVPGYRSPIVALRRELDVFANLRPSRCWPVYDARRDIDLLIVRENTECLYVGRERREGETAIAERIISRHGSERVARVAFQLAMQRKGHLTIVHKANILRVSDGLWRETCLAVAREFPEVQTDEALVDSVAYHLVRQPGRYDVLLTPNLYGDILSDLAAALAGGLGMAPSLSLGAGCAIAEPVHGAAPDIAGRGIANPLGAILSVALLLRYVWQRRDLADVVERAVEEVLAQGVFTPDIAPPGQQPVDTRAMEQAVLAALRA